MLNGSKTFISNGIHVPTWSSSSPDRPRRRAARASACSSSSAAREGFERGRILDKIGQKSQDTAELFFEDVRVPKENLLGEEGAGFVQLMTQLAQERMVDRAWPRSPRRSTSWR